MMATEPSGDDPAALSVSSQLQLIDQPSEVQRHDLSGTTNLSVLNSNEPSDSPIIGIERNLNSVDVSVSGGSDTEASRTDWSRQKDADKGHGRSSSSAKKPATFKAVSVNKTFLALKATPSGTAAKPIDKPISGSSTPPHGTSFLSSSRPRLIAKTGGGPRDSTPKSLSISNGTKPASAPDPNVVWNKNRPPEPKKFTDEELKKYGIHMASRLNEDDTQGQNKWADIDDDDEDWAPEAITWGDGTKTTLPHLDDPTAPTQDNISAAYVENSQPKTKSPVHIVSRSVAPRPSGLASGKSLVLKPASHEKPSIVAKPIVPATPAKSPWATLPPVDRASPGLGESAAPVHTQPREGTQTKPLHHGLKEMTADDFSRSSWREGSSHSSRELYNSQSGRYEPVADRRGTFKSDLQTKHPALLQHPQATDETVETQVPHQLSRKPNDGPHTRRRGSSSVSTSSNSIHQRGLKTGEPIYSPADGLRTNKMPFPISGGHGISSGEGSVTHREMLRGHPSQSRTNNASSAANSATLSIGAHLGEENAALASGSGEELVDEVEYQKKLMRERIEFARKRRQQEEAREEAAKKERIQKKLEALGPPPEKRNDKKDLSPKEEVSKPTHIQQRVRPALSDSHTHTVETPSVRRNTDVQPDFSSQPASPQSGSQLPPANQPLHTESSTFRSLSQGQDSRHSDPWGGSKPRPDKFPSWGPAVSPSSRNVWGSPDNDRGLGNGTFNPDLGRVTNASTIPSQHTKGPSPIAPPNNGTRSTCHLQAQTAQANTLSSQRSTYVPPGSDLASKWVSSVAENDQTLTTARLAERAGRERHMMDGGMTMEDSQPIIKDSWRPMRVPGDGTRHPMGPAKMQSHHPAPWKSTHEGVPKSAIAKEYIKSSTTAGIIGSGAPSQLRLSRFFPTRDVRQGALSGSAVSRSNSPTPPPPTMEDHPVFEGDVLRPHVSLPRPQPVVKLPPPVLSMDRNSSRHQGTRLLQATLKNNQHEDRAHMTSTGNEGVWQARFHRLLHGDKSSSHAKDIGIDASSRGLLDTVGIQLSAIVSLPNSTTSQENRNRLLITKPMAEECFEEQEMGSLPQIRLPHKAPEAAWQPAIAQPKGLPRKFLVQAAAIEPLHIPFENSGGLDLVNVLLPGMKETRTVSLPNPSNRGSRGSHGQRAATRHRNFGSGLRGGKKEGLSAQDSDTSHRSGRSGFRSRGSDNWGRHQSSQSHILSRPLS